MTLDLELALTRVKQTRSRPKLTESQKMNFRNNNNKKKNN